MLFLLGWCPRGLYTQEGHNDREFSAAHTGVRTNAGDAGDCGCCNVGHASLLTAWCLLSLFSDPKFETFILELMLKGKQWGK